MEPDKSIIPDNNLLYEEIRYSFENNLMSWIRTTISLISFGFTIYKFFDEFQQNNPVPRLLTSRIVGIFMILLGFICLLFAHLQHRIAYKKLKERCPGIKNSLAAVLSGLILLFSLLLLLAAILRQ